MKNLRLLCLSIILFVFVSGIYGQNTTTEPTNYKITFTDVDEFQLKELVPVCSEIFDASAGNKGESNVLYYHSNLSLTQEQLKAKLEEKGVYYNLVLEIVDGE